VLPRLRQGARPLSPRIAAVAAVMPDEWPPSDESLARAGQQGTWAHTALLLILSEHQDKLVPALTGDQATRLAVAAAVTVVPIASVEGRSHRQRVAGAVHVVLTRLLPPPPWKYAGPADAQWAARPDLLWSHPGGLVMADEVKTGHGVIRSQRTRDQIHRQVASGVASYGARFLGVRVLSTREPARSWFAQPGQSPVELTTTHHLMCPLTPRARRTDTRNRNVIKGFRSSRPPPAQQL
jgi:hypothetical protein